MKIKEIDKIIPKFNNSSHPQLPFFLPPQEGKMDFSVSPECMRAPLSSWLVVPLTHSSDLFQVQGAAPSTKMNGSTVLGQ